MSQYNYHCEDCNKERAQNHQMSDVETAQVTCPHCGGRRVQQPVAAPSPPSPAKKS